MSVAGIDFSSRAVDIVLIDETSDRAEWHRCQLSGADAFERTRDVPAAFPGRSNSFWDEVVAVGIEQPRGRNALVALGRIQGAILAQIPAWMLVQPWQPAEWRKAVGLPGNASKDLVMAQVRARLGGSLAFPVEYLPEDMVRMQLWNSDACDAYCIALATRQVVQKANAA